MDRDIRRVLTVCALSLGLTLFLLALRLDSKSAATQRAAIARSAAEAPVAVGLAGAPAALGAAGGAAAAPRRVSLTDKADVEMTQFASQAWSGGLAGEEIDPEDAAADAEEAADPLPEPPVTRRARYRKGKKRKLLTADELEVAMQDPEDAADDGKDDVQKDDEVDPADEISRAENLETAAGLTAAIAAEDAEEDDEDEDELLGGGK